MHIRRLCLPERKWIAFGLEVVPAEQEMAADERGTTLIRVRTSGHAY
jgi:hypothetical protein